MSTAIATRVSEAEYLAFERKATEKHELVNGRVVAMSGARPRHNAVAMRIGAALVTRLRGKGCTTLNSDQRVHVPATGLYTYPDVTVVCGGIEMHPEDDMTVLNPRLLVEVLSESTEAYDRGAKFAHYRSIPSLRTYLMIPQGAPTAERYERSEGGLWVLHEHVGLDADIDLPALSIAIPLAEIFEDLPGE